MKRKSFQISMDEEITAFNHLLREGESAFLSGDLSTYHCAIIETDRMLARFCRSGFCDLALMLELSWYQSLVKKIENDEHYEKCFRHHAEAMWSAGKKIAPAPPPSGDPRRIAFIAQNSVLLGHTEVMLLILEDWKRRYPDLKPLFVGLTPCTPDLKSRLSKIEVESITPSEKGSPLSTTRWLRLTLEREKVHTAIWLSLPVWVPFVFGYGVARRQILWSLKFHAVHLGSEIVHIGMTKTNDGVVDIHGKPWLAFQPPLAVAINERSTEKRAQLRSKFNCKFWFGTLAREEKFNSPDFVNAVIKILQMCPESIFIFTGRSVSPMLENTLKKKGLSNRSVFVGWVDTELYSNLLDCFLESFPFGCGVTGMQALSHGTPVVSLWGTDTLPRFYFKWPKQASDFHSNWAISENVDDYIKAAAEHFRRWKQGGERKTISRQSINALDHRRCEQFLRLVIGEAA